MRYESNLFSIWKTLVLRYLKKFFKWNLAGYKCIYRPLNFEKCDVFFLFVQFDLFFRMRFVCCNKKKKKEKNDKKQKHWILNTKKVPVSIQNKKISFDMGVTFPFSQDSELVDKNLNNLVEESKAKNTKKYTLPSNV